MQEILELVKTKLLDTSVSQSEVRALTDVNIVLSVNMSTYHTAFV